MKGSGKYSLGKSSRNDSSISKVPGPGTYDSKHIDAAGKITFSKDTKLKHEVNPNPGPGHYELKPTFADVPSYLLPKNAW